MLVENNQNTFQPSTRSEATFPALPTFSRRSSICVIGAGAFGGWTSLFLQRLGYQVTLVDAWGPGNSRSSSGDETRVIRSTYGSNKIYFDMNVRALDLWKEYQMKFSRKVFYNSGVLWFCYENSNPIVDDSIPFAVEHNMEYEKLAIADLNRRFEIVDTAGLSHAFFDPYGGYLKAREACDEVVNLFIQNRGIYKQCQVAPGNVVSSHMKHVRTLSGDSIQADVFIFACGSWLPKIFPSELGDHIHCTKQAVFYFGTPAESHIYDDFPAWIDLDGQDFYYGIAGNARRGFKIGVDKRGNAFDPENGDRTVDEKILSKARQFLGRRFPGLKTAPLLEARICPYENSRTGNFIFDRHPSAENIFFLGGGSGHGFKHGPALGELIANTIAGTDNVPDLFRIFPRH